MRQRLFTCGLLIVSAAAAAGITTITPAQIPRAAEVTLPQDARLVCQPIAKGRLLASALGEITATQGGQPVAAAGKIATGEVESLTIVRGVVPRGGILGPDGQFTPCQPPATKGLVAWPDASRSELRITNPDAADAVVDLRILGPDGEIDALGARGIALGPGETKPVAVSVLAKEAGNRPVAVEWSTSRGRASAVGLTTGKAGHIAASTTAVEAQWLPGQGEDGRPRIVLTNPGLERATATVTLHSGSSTFVPEGGKDVSLAPGATMALDLARGTAGEIGTFSVRSDKPLGAILISGTAEPAGAAVGTQPATTLAGVVPGGATLQLTNVGEADDQARVTIGGRESSVQLVAGVTTKLTVDGAGPVEVQVRAAKPVVAAAVTAGGRAVVPLGQGERPTVTSLSAEYRPSLR